MEDAKERERDRERRRNRDDNDLSIFQSQKYTLKYLYLCL